METKSALIIEDNDDQAMIIAQHLIAWGYMPEICKDGRIARDRIAEHLEKTSVIVVDLHLPFINGLELLEDIAQEPFYNESRTVVTTADPDMAQSVNSSVKVFIKPVVPAEFKRFLETDEHVKN